MDLKHEIKEKLSSRKDNGWREFVGKNNSVQIQAEFTDLVSSALKKGHLPVSKDVLDAIIFEGVIILDADVLMRLK